MSTDVNIAKQVVYDSLESQIRTAKAKVGVLEGQAQGTMVRAEVKAFEALLPKIQAIQQKLQELKMASGDQWRQTKADLEALITDFEQSVKAIEAEARAS